MQEMNSDIVKNTAVGTVKLLTDTRENGSKSYTVKKLADGNIWMTDNLKLGFNTNNPNSTTIELKLNDSNVEQNRTLTAYDLVTYGTSGKHCYGTSSGTDTGYYNPCIHSRNTTDDTIGVWYNYALATAGTITGPSSNVEAVEDICPKGWKLPSLSDSQAIISAISSAPTPFNPLYGGYYNNATLLNATTRGYWWSTTPYDANYPYLLRYDSGILDLTQGYRFGGTYIRCIAR